MGCWQFDADCEDLGIMFKLCDSVSFYYGHSEMVMVFFHRYDTDIFWFTFGGV